MENLIHEIERLNLKILVVVIDDSSPDGTAERVTRLQERYENVHLVSRPEKLGLGTAITDGFRYVLGLTERPDYIVTMDADYSHDPEDIPRLVKTAEKRSGLVVGSRYIPGGNIVGFPVWRRLISRAANAIAAMTVRAELHDFTSGFRCYSRRYVEKVLPNLHSQTYEIQIETVKQARLNLFKVHEVPITFVGRENGKSKLAPEECRGFLMYVAKAVLSKERL